MSATYINPALPSMIRGLYRADLRERSIQNMLDLAADLVQELIDMREKANQEPSDDEVLEASLTFERVWDEIIDSFDPERDDGITYIQAAMRAALIAAQEARDES